MEDGIIVQCRFCGRKNRVPKDRLHNRPLCGNCHRPLEIRAGTVRPVDVSDRTFVEEVIHHAGPVLAAFLSPRCPYCRQLAPVIDGIASDYAGRVKVVRVDTDRSGVITSQFDIKGVPTILLFKNGSVVRQLVGVLSRDEIVRYINAIL
ncbi:MAG: thioredoxin family protein [Syntrophales bacterium]